MRGRGEERPSHLESDAGGSSYSHPSVLEQLPCDGSRSFFRDLLDVIDLSMSVFVFTARNILLLSLNTQPASQQCGSGDWDHNNHR